MMNSCSLLTLTLVTLFWLSASAFVPTKPLCSVTAGALAMGEDSEEEKGGLFKALGDFWQELDNFMDDASARRLGNGAAFYGKRRSNFYGEKDKMKKKDSNIANPLEDYRGPSTAGYFKWMPDEDGQMRPVTRMKEQIVEKKGPWFGSSEE